MDPSKEAEEELKRMYTAESEAYKAIRKRQREEEMERMEREVVWPQIAIVVAVILALWALNKYLEDEVRRMDSIEYKQQQQHKFTEM